MTCSCSKISGPVHQKINCWEYKACGREPGGKKAKEAGECPAASSSDHHSVNGGSGGGRYCWRVYEKSPSGMKMPHWSEKERNCLGCAFMAKVRTEEGPDFRP